MNYSKMETNTAKMSFTRSPGPHIKDEETQKENTVSKSSSRIVSMAYKGVVITGLVHSHKLSRKEFIDQ